MENFDEHLRTIKSQMADDVARSKEENEMIRRETEELDAKFQELS